MIDISSLTYRYQGAARDSLVDIHLHVAPGEFLVLTGPSGCGKSTLALAIGGYLFRQYDGQADGTVIVGGLGPRGVVATASYEATTAGSALVWSMIAVTSNRLVAPSPNRTHVLLSSQSMNLVNTSAPITSAFEAPPARTN